MESRPNILFIMSDDHATNAISCYGSRLAGDAPTANIDRIAREGIRLENCHCTNSICTPSRASILTGQHSHRNRVRTLSDPLPRDAVTLPELLRRAGYETALFGKWHLHAEPRGFDDWAILPGQGLYYDPLFVFPDRASAPEGTVLGPDDARGFYDRIEATQYDFGTYTRQPGYVTDIVTDMSLQWLERRKGHKPFFLCCQHKAPHDFFEYSTKHERAFESIAFREPETLFEDDATREEISRKYGSTVSERFAPRNMVKHLMNPQYPNGGPVDFSGLDADGRTRKAYQKYMQDYLRTVRSIDDNVGRILDYLDEAGLAETTIVVYTSDQGMMLGEHDHIDKRWIFDESQRMPLLVRYPRAIEPGSVTTDMVDNTDFAPTFLEYAGADIPSWMQGRSVRPVLEGRTPVDWRQSVYYRYWMHMAHHWVPAHYGVRTREHKLVYFYGMKLDATGCNHPDCDIPFEPGFELYDMANDPLERTNVYNDPAYSSIAADMKQLLLDLKRHYGDTDEPYPDLHALARRSFS